MNGDDLSVLYETINKNKNLRGCIGSLVAHRELYDDLINNAVSAAFKDPRFKPVLKEEFNELEIEVSILTTPVEVFYSDINDLKTKIIPNKDGIILRQGNNQATFLPQVWESLNTFELFFEALCKKARLESNCLNLHPQIFKYSVKKYK